MPPPTVYSTSTAHPNEATQRTRPAYGSQSSSNTMATIMQQSPSHAFPPIQTRLDQRPRLPPLLPIGRSDRAFEGSSPVSPPTSASPHQRSHPSRSSSMSLTQSVEGGRYPASDYRGPAMGHYGREPPQPSQPPWTTSSNLSTRYHAGVSERHPCGSTTYSDGRGSMLQQQPIISPIYTDSCSSPYQSSHSRMHHSTRTSVSDPITPGRRQTLSFATGPPVVQVSPVKARSFDPSRCYLHIRQQPRAARAGPDGKDRRAIDPPPVLQLLLNNFDSESEEDMDEIRSTYYVVHCRLLSAHSPERDMSTLSSMNDDGSIEVQRLLLGTTVSSPFFCQNDPDPDNMPKHPQACSQAPEIPQSPTSRFIQTRRSSETSRAHLKRRPEDSPGSFFIFPDLSIRKAGEYRLLFSLMKIEPESMLSGSKLPIIASATSHIFRVVNAKDFDQVQPSTELIKGLLDQGAGYPLKLKKGTREGQGGRTSIRRDGSYSNGGSNQDGSDQDDEEDEES